MTTTDGGNSWKQETRFTDDAIIDIYFKDEKKGWILTDKGKFSGGAVAPSAILKTEDGGKSWRKTALEGGQNERLTRIFFSKNGIGRAIGESGAFYEMKSDSQVWKKAILPTRFLLLGGSFPNDSKGTIVGGGGSAIYTENAGIDWKSAGFTKRIETKLNSVFFINPNIGWLVGVAGKIFSTNNGGKLWWEQKSNTSENLHDIFFINTAEGWAVGEQGLILHTRAAGNIWQIEQSNTKHKLERVFAIGDRVWAVGFGGTILQSEKSK